MEKNCTKCGLTKNIEDFPKCPECKDGYRNQCKRCVKSMSDVWRNNNPDSHKIWREKNIDYDKERKQIHYQNNKDKYIQQSIEYRKNNTDKVNQRVRDYRKKRFSEDEVFKLTFTVRSRIRKFLKLTNSIKLGQTFDLIGCTPQELIKYIENLFTDGMNWGNHGEWHIDHIVPLSSAKTKEDLMKLCHYTNLQPLWAKDNLSKSDKIINNTPS
jgi:hypothetical protein